ncbi:MAG TPA: hypothetical protein VF046_03955 [Gemmatimonadales bacterium]
MSGKRVAAGAGAVGALGLAVYTAVTESMPELRIYDGYWMLLGAAVAVAVVAPLVWSWRREWSLGVVVAAAVVGCWLPIVWLAMRRGSQVMPRIEGTWHLMGGDVVAAAVPVGVACLWMALRDADPDRQLRH